MEPREQTNLFGYSKEFNNIINIYNSGKLPNKIIFSGKKGIGKSTFAFHLINYINSINETDNYNLQNLKIINTNRSFKLQLQNIHPNIHYIGIKKGKKIIEIDEIRNLNSFVNRSSFNDGLKIVLIDDLEMLSPNASNALLKLIEEPNKNVQYILIYNNTKFVIDTIKSRCINFKFYLKEEYYPDVVNDYFKTNIYNELNSDFKNIYLTPMNLINVINLINDNKFNLEEVDIEKLLEIIVNNELYKTRINDISEFKLYLEIFFLKKYKKSYSLSLLKKINYLNSKFSNILRYNLDLSSFILEFRTLILNEK